MATPSEINESIIPWQRELEPAAHKTLGKFESGLFRMDEPGAIQPNMPVGS